MGHVIDSSKNWRQFRANERTLNRLPDMQLSGSELNECIPGTVFVSYEIRRGHEERNMNGRRGLTEAGILREANRLLIDYLGYENDIAFLSVPHKWGLVLALELNEHFALIWLTAEDACTLLKVVESIREQLSQNYIILNSN